MPGELGPKMWLTAQTAANLVYLSKGELKEVERAAKFLLWHRDESGIFKGYTITTWVCVPLFSFLEGKGCEVVSKSLEFAEKWV